MAAKTLTLGEWSSGTSKYCRPRQGNIYPSGLKNRRKQPLSQVYMLCSMQTLFDIGARLGRQRGG